jgi:hypothetical protein
MAVRSRFLRIAGIVFLVLAFAGYFAFSTFVFSPTESDYDPDVSTLVPRDVDFFVAKSELRRDFESPTRLAIQDELEDTEAWRTWLESPEYAALDAQLGIEEQLARVRAEVEKLGVDPLKVFGGRDLALAGYFRGPTFEQADWAAYGRCNWMGKLAVAGLRHPDLIGLEKQGLSAALEGNVITLSGGELTRPIHVARLRDIVIAGTSKELVTRAFDFEARGGQESFGLSANYHDNVASARRTARGDDIELYCDWRTLAEKMRIDGRVPDPQSDSVLLALFARMFQLGSLRSLAGTIGFDGGVLLDAHGDLSTETMTPFQKTLYRQRGRDAQQIVQQLAFLARPDAQIVAHLEADLGDLLREVHGSLQGATRTLIDDALRATGHFNNSGALITELDTLFKGRIGVIVHENDYPPKQGDPPHNDVPVPAVALVLWIEGGEKSYARLNELQRLVSDNQGKFGLRGPDGGRGVFTHTLSNGVEVWEFWNPLIDGTGHFASCRDGDYYFLSNSYAMLADLVSRTNQSASLQRLSDQPQFTQLVNETLPASNLFLWLNPRSLAATLRAFSERGVTEQIRAELDWDTLRAVEEDKVIREKFPGQRRGQLEPDAQAQVDAIVGPLLDEYERRQMNERAPALRAQLERHVLYGELCSAALLTVGLDPKAIDVELSAIVPLEE